MMQVKNEQHISISLIGNVPHPGLILVRSSDYTPKKPLYDGMKASLQTRFAKPVCTALVSAEESARLLAEERRRDESDFHGGAPDLGRSLMLLLEEELPEGIPAGYWELIDELGLSHLLERGIRAFSTGELRKLALLRAVLMNPELLILDEPFDGLDALARERLVTIIRREAVERTVLVVSGRRSDLVLLGGEIRDIDGQARPRTVLGGRIHDRDTPPTEKRKGEILVEMRNVALCYGDTPILRDISITVRRGEAWRIYGPNGAGKTTLTELITGENQKAYGQDIWLFGRKKGSGESVWEIKERIGHLSPVLHQRIPLRDTVETTILSGLYDSIGLYRKPTSGQRQRAAELASLFGIDDILHTRMSELSFGLQRVALVLRGLIKEPELLIFDEPCQGLDDENTDAVLDAVSTVVERGLSTVLFISHDPLQEVRGITHSLELYRHELGGCSARVQSEGVSSGNEAM